jgi:hypothetical protein
LPGPVHSGNQGLVGSPPMKSCCFDERRDICHQRAAMSGSSRLARRRRHAIELYPIDELACGAAENPMGRSIVKSADDRHQCHRQSAALTGKLLERNG